jgi:hypothetical protein
MLGVAASCRHRFNIEYVNDYRLANRSRWFPPRVKSLLAEVLYARDLALALNKEPGEVDGIVARAAEKWSRDTRAASTHDEDLAATMRAIEDDVAGILVHYEDAHASVAHAIKRKGKPVVRRIVEHRLPTFERKKIGGPSKYTVAHLLDRLTVNEDGEPMLVVRHLTSNADPLDVRTELGHRLDIPGLCWAASKLNRKPVRVVEFDFVRTKPPSIPNTTKCRHCKDGYCLTEDDSGLKVRKPCPTCNGTGVGGMSVAACDTTWAIWNSKLEQYKHLDHDKQREAARSLLNRLAKRGESFAYRVRRFVTDEQIDSWLADTYETIREIETARRRGTWPRNPRACAARGSVCPYRRVCAGTLRDEAVYEIADDPYPGLYSWW